MVVIGVSAWGPRVHGILTGLVYGLCCSCCGGCRVRTRGWRPPWSGGAGSWSSGNGWSGSWDAPFPGLDPSGPGVGWGVFALSRGQEEEIQEATHCPGLQPALHPGLRLRVWGSFHMSMGA